MACVRRITGDGQVTEPILSFGTITAELLASSDWSAARGVTQVALGSTGVSRKPVFHLLEDRSQVMLVNAQHLKPVPGRKTDVKDAPGFAEWLQHGLLSPSFVPPPPIREWRDLTRQPTQSVREEAAVADRIQKVREDANIELAGVASDPLGVSGGALIRGLIAGRDDADDRAEEARARLRAKIPQLRLAPPGRVTEHPRSLLRMQRERVEHLEGQIERFDGRIAEARAPLAAAADRLGTIPGLSATSAEGLVAEMGTDLGRFPSAGHLASWAGRCPGDDETAGERRSGRTTEGDPSWRARLVQVGWAAVPAEGTIFQADDGRWIKRRGKEEAPVAVAPKVVVLIDQRLKTATDSQERWVAEPAA